MTTDKPTAESRYLDRLLARLAEATRDLRQQCDAKIQEAARLAFEDILKGISKHDHND